MKILKWIGVVCAAVLMVSFAVFVTPLRYVLDAVLHRAMAPKIIQNVNTSARTDLRFFTCLKNGSWIQAHGFLTDDCQRVVSPALLRQEWQAIEAKHGKNEVWQRNETGIGLMPDFVENEYLLRGKTGMGHASLRLVRENGNWRIQKLIMTP